MKIWGKRVRFGRLAFTLLWACAVPLLLAGMGFAADDGELPSLKDLEHPAKSEKGESKKKEEIKYPRRLTIEEANLQPQYLLPPGPLCYMDVPNGETLGQSFDETSIALLLANQRVKTFFKDNPLNSKSLFSDLPPAYTSAEGITLLMGGRYLAEAFLRAPRRVVVAVYRVPGRGLAVVFLADIGRNREAPFKELEIRRDKFLEGNANFVVNMSKHSDDFIDVIRSDDESSELAYGIVRNYALVCTNVAFAQDLLAAAGQEQKGLSGSVAYADLGTYTDSKAQLRGFINLRGILDEARANILPDATEMLDLTCDVLGRGGAGGGPSMIYYDLRAEGKRVIEHIVSPTQVNEGENEGKGIPARLREICKPAEDLANGQSDWVTPRLVPYQSNLFMAAHVRPSELSTFFTIRKNEHFGKSPYAKELSRTIPKALGRVISEDLGPKIDEILSGEVGLALLPQREKRRDWILALAVTNAAEAERLFSDRPASESNGVKIYSSPGEWRKQVCWAVFDQSVFKHITSVFQKVPSSCAVITSTGVMMEETIDQVTTISSLADNKDFLAQIKVVGRDQSMLWYLNLPGITNREYANTPRRIRTYFPRLTNLSNLPPMTMVSRHATGIASGISVNPANPYCRSTIVSPGPTIPAIAGLMTMHFPSWVRERSRKYQKDSRDNLGRVWLALQTYATQRGHYPESLAELKKHTPDKNWKKLLTCEAAIDYLGAEEAVRQSYKYVPGMRTTDEPDLPIIYESDAWHYEYSGMVPTGDDLPQEEGDYQSYRLVLRLDGTIKAYSQEDFKKKVLPRLRSREE